MTGEPFRLDGDDRGVLLLHGFAGSPFAVRPLGETLHARGFTVAAPLLPGHGDTPAALDATAWRDWLAAAGAALGALRRRCRSVGVAGLSMGGLLTLRLAQTDPDLKAIAVMAVPLWLSFPVRTTVRALAALGALSGTFPVLPNFGGSDIRDPEMKRIYPSPAGFPARAVASLLDFMREVRRDLPRVRTPALVIHSDHDHTAPPHSAREIVRRIASPDKKLVRLPRSFHIVTLDVERDRVAATVGDFFQDRM
ncbi:MAG TPA: alpha/beta fold hydrolase [Haliangiales bacterium]|nr:alpha/beta fold hydrolase [Haliangiales bacterium]